MFPFGHVGLAVGVIVAGLLIAKRPDVLGKVDFRIVVVLAMLPDIIDKPLGHFILGESLNNGRTYSHTLVFLLLVAIVCIIVFKKLFWVYVLPVVGHQTLDMMWDNPKAMFWPIYGFGFKQMDMDVWSHWWEELAQNEYVLIGEMAGLLILVTVFVFFRIYQKDNFLLGLKKGRLNP